MILAHGTVCCALPLFVEFVSKWSVSSFIFSLTPGSVVLRVTVSFSKRPPPLKSSWLAEATMQGSWGLTETEVAIMEPAWVCARASAYVMVAGLVFLGGFLTVETEVSILPALTNPFSYWYSFSALI